MTDFATETRPDPQAAARAMASAASQVFVDRVNAAESRSSAAADSSATSGEPPAAPPAALDFTDGDDFDFGPIDEDEEEWERWQRWEAAERDWTGPSEEEFYAVRDTLGQLVDVLNAAQEEAEFADYDPLEDDAPAQMRDFARGYIDRRLGPYLDQVAQQRSEWEAHVAEQARIGEQEFAEEEAERVEREFIDGAKARAFDVAEERLGSKVHRQGAERLADLLLPLHRERLEKESPGRPDNETRAAYLALLHGAAIARTEPAKTAREQAADVTGRYKLVNTITSHHTDVFRRENAVREAEAAKLAIHAGGDGRSAQELARAISKGFVARAELARVEG